MSMAANKKSECTQEHLVVSPTLALSAADFRSIRRGFLRNATSNAAISEIEKHIRFPFVTFNVIFSRFQCVLPPGRGSGVETRNTSDGKRETGMAWSGPECRPERGLERDRERERAGKQVNKEVKNRRAHVSHQGEIERVEGVQVLVEHPRHLVAVHVAPWRLLDERQVELIGPVHCQMTENHIN